MDRYKRTPGMPGRRKAGYRRDGYATYPEGSARTRGAEAYKAGVPREKNPCPPGRVRWKNWDDGWIKAKLAEEQGKASL